MKSKEMFDMFNEEVFVELYNSEWEKFKDAFYENMQGRLIKF